MNLESIYKLSVIMNMVDNISSPMSKVGSTVTDSTNKMSKLGDTLGQSAKTGAVVAGVGASITQATLEPVTATFSTRKALGELSAMGVKDLQALEEASKQFSDTWAGTTKAEFLTAAIDIKGGIDSLTEEGISKYTEIAGITAKATGSTIDEMTSLFATGYGIYKDYYSDLSDIDFAEVFSAGIAQAILVFKASGSSMAESITALGGSATTANVPLEEQLAVLGMLQATMSGSEAGTKYRAFLRTAAKAGEELKLSFLDANNQLKSMPEILGTLKSKYGETLDAIEKQEIQTAFGSDEAVALIDLMYSKTGTLQDSILELYGSMGQGVGVATTMASAINNMEPDKYEVLQQRIQNVKESIGNTLLPTVNELIDKSSNVVDKVSEWVSKNQALVKVIMVVVLVLGIFLTVAGTTIAVVSGVGLVVTKTAGFIKVCIALIRGIPGLLTTLHIKALYTGDALKLAFMKMKVGASMAVQNIKYVVSSILSFAKAAVVNGVTAVKSFVLGMVGMAKQAIVTAVTALPGLIAAVWSFTAALLANPVTWVVIGIMALIAALIALWKNWDSVVAFIKGVFTSFVNGIINGFNWIKDKVASLPGVFQILLAAIFPIIGIPMLIANHWETIVAFFSGLWTKVKTTFVNGIQAIKNFLFGVPTWFKESGGKIMETFTEGIKNAISKPVEAVKSGLAKIRKLLPFSDAKEGPLSTLTLSGRRVLETITTGITQREDMPSEAVEDSFKKVDFTTTKKAIAKVKLSGSSDQQDSSETGSSKKDKNLVIQKLIMQVDLKDIEDIKRLQHLLAELEEVTNGNGIEVSDEDLEFA